MTTVFGNSLEVLPHDLLKIFNGREPVLFLDYDGTLAPIVSDPQQAIMSGDTRSILEKLSSVINVAIVSGRDRQDVAGKVDFDHLIYAGSHGYDISGPDGFGFQLPEGREALVDLDEATERLQEQLRGVQGAVVERKKYAIAVHYRNVMEADVPKVKSAVGNVLKDHEKLKKGEGK